MAKAGGHFFLAATVASLATSAPPVVGWICAGLCVAAYTFGPKKTIQR